MIQFDSSGKTPLRKEPQLRNDELVQLWVFVSRRPIMVNKEVDIRSLTYLLWYQLHYRSSKHLKN